MNNIVTWFVVLLLSACASQDIRHKIIQKKLCGVWRLEGSKDYKNAIAFYPNGEIRTKFNGPVNEYQGHVTAMGKDYVEWKNSKEFLSLMFNSRYKVKQWPEFNPETKRYEMELLNRYYREEDNLTRRCGYNPKIYKHLHQINKEME